MWKENSKTRWKMQRGRNWWDGSKKMDGKYVLNGNKQEEEVGEWTYIGSRGETVINYGIVNEESWERVEEFRIERE
jgi:hypothetical protein